MLLGRAKNTFGYFESHLGLESVVSISSRKLQLTLFSAAVLLFTVYREQQLQHVIGDVGNRAFTLTAFMDNITLPAWVEWVRRVAIVCLMVLIWSLFASNKITRFPRAAFHVLVAMICWRIALMLWSLASGDWRFTSIFDQVGLLVVASSVLLALGGSKAWASMPRLFAFAAVLASMAVLVSFVSWEPGNRAAGIREFRGYSYLLMSTLLFALAYPAQRAWKLVFGGGAIAAFTVVAVATETRAAFVFLATALIFYGYLCRQSWSRAGLAFVAALVIICASLFLVFDLFGSGSVGLGARLYEDTRTAQLINFLRVIEIWEFIAGSPAAGNDARFAGELNRWGVDSGLLAILYVGGVPLLLGYLWLHVRPAVGCLKTTRLTPSDAAAVATVLAFSIQMISSEMPALSEGYILVLVMMGRCLAIHYKLGSAK